MSAAVQIEWSDELPPLDVVNIGGASIDNAANDNAHAEVVLLRENSRREFSEQAHLLPLGETAASLRKYQEKSGSPTTLASDPVFTGKEEDVEVGLQYFGKRFLNPLLGRWISADPLAVHAPGEADLNLYAYVEGRPLRDIDPLGLCPWCVGAAIGAGLDVAFQSIEILSDDSKSFSQDFNVGSVLVSAAGGATGVGLGAQITKVVGKIAVKKALSKGMTKGAQMVAAGVVSSAVGQTAAESKQHLPEGSALGMRSSPTGGGASVSGGAIDFAVGAIAPALGDKIKAMRTGSGSKQAMLEVGEEADTALVSKLEIGGSEPGPYTLDRMQAHAAAKGAQETSRAAVTAESDKQKFVAGVLGATGSGIVGEGTNRAVNWFLSPTTGGASSDSGYQANDPASDNLNAPSQSGRGSVGVSVGISF